MLIIKKRGKSVSQLLRTLDFPLLVILGYLGKNNLVVLCLNFAFFQQPTYTEESLFCCNACCLCNLCYCQSISCCSQSLVNITSFETYILCCKRNYSLLSCTLACSTFFTVSFFSTAAFVAAVLVVFFSAIIFVCKTAS